MTPDAPTPLVRPYAQLRQMLWDFEQAEGRRVMREKDMRHANALLLGPHQHCELRADPEFARSAGFELTRDNRIHGLQIVLVRGDMFHIAYVPGLPPNPTY